VDQEGLGSFHMYLQQPYNGVCGGDAKEACELDHNKAHSCS
jgi:hypothetical protein